MYRSFFMLTVAAGISLGTSYAHAKGGGHSSHSSGSHSMSHSSSNSSNHKTQSNNSSKSHKSSQDSHDKDHCDHCDKNCDKNCDKGTTTTFNPGGVPFGHGPVGTPSNPTIRDHRGLIGATQITQVSGIKGTASPIATTTFNPGGVPFGTGPQGTPSNPSRGHAGHGGPPMGGRQTSDWDAAGEAVQGLGDALGDGLSAIGGFFDPGFTGPPVKN